MRRVLTARRLAAAAALPLLVSGVAACGSDEPSMGEEASETSSDKSKTSSEEETEDETEAGQEVDPKSFAEDVAEGLDSLTTARMTMEMSGGQGDMTMEGVVDYTRDTPALAATMSSAAGMPEGMEVIMLDGVMYMSDPSSKGKYMKLDLNDPDGPMASMGQLTEQMDLRTSMKTFTEALTKVTYVGEEEVGGEDLERYEMTMDPSKAEATKGMAAGTGPITYDAWFDDDKVMRQMVVEMPEGMGTMSMQLSDLGTDVEIEAPPANKIVEMPGM